MNYLLSKLRSCLGATRRIRSFLNQKSLLTLYHSLFKSRLQYCITNWCYTNKTLVNKLQQLCNKFIRMTFGLKRNYNINDIMSKSKILNINQMLFKEINVLMFKQNIGKNPNVLQKQRLTIIRATNRPGMAGTVPELTSGVPCPGLGHFCPGIY